MGLLIDSDAFCKFGICGLIEKVASTLGSSLGECSCLTSLPYMLKKGHLVKAYGSDNCERLRRLACSMKRLAPPGDEWLDKMSPIAGIDPGEAQLFAASIEQGSLLLTGDKRAIKAVSRVVELRTALERRIVTMEAALLAVSGTEDLVALRSVIRPAVEYDKTLGICFSEGNSDPARALRSYQDGLSSEIGEMILWSP